MKSEREAQMKYLALSIMIFVGTSMMHGGGDDLKVIYDPRPEIGIPEEARHAGTQPKAEPGRGQKAGVTFSTVSDLKNYGPFRNVIEQKILSITVRYFDSSFVDIKEVRTYLTSILQSEIGSTAAYCPWAEALSYPSVEAQIQFESGAAGKWLIWRSGRSVYRGPDKKWWFTYDWKS